MTVTCCACGEKILKKDATRVPSTSERREQWIQILGEKFRRNVNKYRCPYICADHFDEGVRKKRNRLPNPVSWNHPPPELHDHWVWMFEEQIEERMETSSESENSEVQRMASKSMTSSTVDDDDEEEEEVDEGAIPEKPAHHKYLFASTDSVVSLLKKCHTCGRDGHLDISFSGFTVTATCECINCERRWKWTNSKLCESNKPNYRNGRLKELHLDIASAILLTGCEFQRVKQFFDVLNMSSFSSRTYNKLKSLYVYPAIEKWYGDMMNWVKDKMMDEVDENGSVNLIGDGSFDSRGNSARFCRYIIMEASLKLAIDFEIVRQKSGDTQHDLEKEGFEKCLHRVKSNFEDFFNRNAVTSFTSDRSKGIANSMREHFPQIDHFFDSWHYFRNIAMDIMKKKKLKKFKPVLDWIRSFLNHLYYSVSESQGNGEMAKERVLSFFYHVTDLHKNFDKGHWFQLTHFTACEHGDIDEFDEQSASFLNSNSKKDVKALNILFDILKKGKRLEDIGRVSPFFATSAIESLNSRAVVYATKDHFFSDAGFRIRTMLTIIDWNERRKDEIEGRRVVIGEKTYYNKTSKMFMKKDVKTPSTYEWRRGIVVMAHALRASMRATVIESEEDDDETGENVRGEEVAMRELEEDDADSIWDNLQIVDDDDDSEDEVDRDIEAIWNAMALVEEDEEEEEDEEVEEDDNRRDEEDEKV
ncbi:unnamed protein product [Caenorhabditis brenneri]